MGFWALLALASAPVIQVMLVGLLGAFLATGGVNVLMADARKHMNKVVYFVFTPALVFASLARTVTLQDIISWWFMPVNIGLIYLIGGTLGWAAVKILRPERHLEGLIIAVCSAGNLGNLMVIVVPAVCNEEHGPFGDAAVCRARGLSYASFSMALGGFYIWTHTHSLMKRSGLLYNETRTTAGNAAARTTMASEADGKAGGDGAAEEDLEAPLLPPTPPDEEGPAAAAAERNGKRGSSARGFLVRIKESIIQLAEELTAPPAVAASLGLIVGATPWLKSLVVGAAAPLGVLEDSVKLLGDATIPCITLILGGNLTQGIRKSRLRRSVTLAVLLVKYLLVPASGVAVVKAAGSLGFLPPDPLYRYALLVQYALPPAMSIGTMAELFDVAREESSVLFLWMYLVCALALTAWSTVYMWVLSS